MKGVSRTYIIAIFALGWTTFLSGQQLPFAEHLMKNQVFEFPSDSSTFLPLSNALYKPVNVASMPVFCRMEELVYRKSNINLRFNLGSNDYVKKLEGK